VVRLATMSEAELSDSVIELGHLFGWRLAHFRPARTARGWVTPVAADGKGYPDLCMVRDRIVFAELKSDNGALTVEQQDWLHALGAAGVERYVWRPSDWVDGTIERVLRERVA
jgi:hypothetical protein